MTDIYCGISKIPKGSRRGNMRECAEKGQIRYYGLRKIDDRTLKSAANKKKDQVSYHEAVKLVVRLRARLKRMISEIKAEKDKSKKEKKKEEAKKVQKELKQAVSVANKLEDKKRKAKRSRRSRQ